MSARNESRAARSSRRRDAGTAEEAATMPSFSVGTTTAGGRSRAVAPPRRSTRRAARDAATRIAEEAAARRCRRLNASDADPSSPRTTTAAGRARGGASALGRRGATPSLVAVIGRGRGTNDSPILLDDDDEDGIDGTERKPAAAATGIAAASQKPPSDFTCPICLDAPSTVADIARISGCTHRFCFDCIEKWAETENRCPCCKERFNTIDRVVPLPPSPEPVVAAAGRRGKRKRRAAAGSDDSDAGASRGASRRVNSRTVEDRDQQPPAPPFPINEAIFEQILASFASISGGPPRGAIRVMFGTSDDGRPLMRMVRPQGRDTVGVMEVHLEDAAMGDSEDEGMAGAGAGSRAAGGSGAAAAAGGSSPVRGAVGIRFPRSPGSGSVDAVPLPPRRPADASPPVLLDAAAGAGSPSSNNGRTSTSGRARRMRTRGGFPGFFSGAGDGRVPAGGTTTLTSPGSG